MKKPFVLLQALVLLAGCSDGGNVGAPPPPPPPPALIDMDQVLDGFVADNGNVSSVAMLAVKDGEIVYSHTAGFSDAAHTRAPTEARPAFRFSKHCVAWARKSPGPPAKAPAGVMPS